MHPNLSVPQTKYLIIGEMWEIYQQDQVMQEL